MEQSLLVGLCGIAVLIALILIGTPIAFALFLVAFGGHTLLVGFPQTLAQVGIITWEQGLNFLLIAAPLFIFMGQLTAQTRLAEDFFDCAYKWLGRLPGGLALTAVVSCAGFGAVTGSSLAAVATVGKVVLPEMKRYHYDVRLASGSIAAAGTLAILIPPSILLVFYGIWTETSIGLLFAAGIVPGLLLASAYAILIVVRSLLNPQLGPKGPHFSLKAKLKALVKLLPILFTFFFVLGGIYFGLFTPTESAAFGAVTIAFIAWAMGRLSLSSLKESLNETVVLSSMLYAMLIGGHLMSRFLIHADVTPALIQYIASLEVNSYLIMFLFIIMYLVLGAILDVLGMLLLTIPFVFPIVQGLGFSPIWFGVFVVIMTEVSLITPPIGMNVYFLNQIDSTIPVSEIFKGVLPFIGVTLLITGLLLFFPQIALWLPSTM